MAKKLQTIQKRRSIPLLIIGVLVLGGLIWFFSDTSRRSLFSKGNAVLCLEVSGPALEEGWVWPQDGTAYVTAYDKETNEQREVLPFSLSTPAGKRVLIYGAVPPSCRIDERSLVFYGMEMADDANPPVFRLVGTVTNPGKSNMPLIGKVEKGKLCRMHAAAGWARVKTSSPLPASATLLAMDAPDGTALNGSFAMSPDNVLRMSAIVGKPWPEKYVNVQMGGLQEVWFPLPEGTIPAYTSLILMAEDDNGRAYPECFYLQEDFTIRAGQCTDLPTLELKGKDNSFWFRQISRLMLSPTDVDLHFSDPYIAEVCLVVTDKLSSALKMVEEGDETIIHVTQSGPLSMYLPSDIPNGGVFFLYALAYDAQGNFLRYTVAI